ncbi:putative linoleate 9S-lipoxygenase 5 [Apium graveolens]|uniref:putative linoleate 9S-lipoxygenase 5 n=1 Tax=Apium graveolens TaxID=4045 RepID=UPI003D7B999C
MKNIKGKVVLMKKNVLEFTDIAASVLDRFSELVGNKVSFQLISADNGEVSEKGLRGKVGSPAYLQNWITTITPLTAGEATFDITFAWEEDFGLPGAFTIRNLHRSEFYLKTLILHDVPGHGDIYFICNSWVYPAKRYSSDRVFFANKAYLPSETPATLVQYREEELVILRGTGSGMLEEWDRVYDYAFYNDLGDPDNDPKDARPVLGGSSKYPYPRRGRTGRPPTRTDPNSESKLSLLNTVSIYVPRDERLSPIKLTDFLAYGLKAVIQFLDAEFKAVWDTTPTEFDSFEDVHRIYEGGVKLPAGIVERIRQNTPLEILRELFPVDGEGLAKFPTPQVIKEDKYAWRTDEEFAREMLAGSSPFIITRLQEFPPSSKLDPEVYGSQGSSISINHIEGSLDGLTVDEALSSNRLYILDFHDMLMPFIKRINETSTKMYATRTVVFLQNDGTLKPLAIELSLPHPSGEKYGAVSKVYTPAEEGIEGSLWQLAKAYVKNNDTGVQQLVIHWMKAHAVIEPIIIATNRQLSVVHPINKLLQPHYTDTMHINAITRAILISNDGALERTIFTSPYIMELNSVAYKNSWTFPGEAVPADLIQRGMAVEDSESPEGVRLLIDDYPYAVDALKVWSAIKSWVTDYCSLYYKTDEVVQNDTELQSWWKEIREVGHGDKKDEPWWPNMKTITELIESCTTIIWIASALHAAVNFGQYGYGGYHPNRPTQTRRLMPEEGTPEYEELKSNPDKVYLQTISSQLPTLVVTFLIEALSRHSSEEVYLGQRDSDDWTQDANELEAFERFGKKLREIEEQINELNSDEKKKNRHGPVKVPYTLLYPTSENGKITGMGIPNSTTT